MISAGVTGSRLALAIARLAGTTAVGLRCVNIRPSGADRLAPMKRRSLLIVLALILLLAAAGWWYFARGPLVTAAAATRGTAVEIVYATGGVEPVRWAKVASVVRDRIVEICDCEGKTVKKGDVLARLDDRQARARAQGAEGARGLPPARNVAGERIDHARRGDDAGARARRHGFADGAGADLRANREDRRLHHRGADGRRGAAPRRRDRRNRRSRADPLPRRRAQAAAGRRRGERGRHPARCARADRAVPHRCVSRPAAGRQSERDHAHGRHRRQDLPRQDGAAGRHRRSSRA